MEGERDLLTGLSADYSDDELDAIALLFDRPLLAARRREHPRTSVERAVNEAVLRGLVARRALVLEGGGKKRRVRFLEPHRALLDPFVGAEATIAVWVRRPDRVSATAFFLRGDRAVRQSALPGLAIKRMSLLPRAGAEGEALAALDLDSLPEADGERQPIELSPRMWSAAEDAVAGDGTAAGGPAAALDLLHARTATVELSVSWTDADGTRLLERLHWLAAGTLGTWLVEPGEGDPPASVSVEPAEPASIRRQAADLLVRTKGGRQDDRARP